MTGEMTGLSLLLCISSLYSINAQGAINEDHEVKLNEEHDVRLKWRVDGDDIFFEMSAATLGVVAIGFSPNGGMPGSDIVAGWIKSDEAFISDRHAITYSKPTADLSDDYELLYGYEESGKTTIGFKRKLNTCDTNDYIVTTDTARVIWAVNHNDPTDSDDLIYHGSSRGVRSIVLLYASTKLSELPADAGFFDITMPNVNVPDDKDTTYWCTSFEVPTFDQPVHVIRFDGLIQEGHEALIHHMIVFGCRGNLSAVVGWSSDCNSKIMPPEISNCQKMIYAWTIGGKPFEFPEHVGFPLGGEDDPTFFVIEMHYDNPAFSPDFHDSSGLRVYYTPTVREYIADIWMVGEGVSSSHMIPPNESEFKTYGFCFGECTKSGMEDDVNVLAVILHSHLAARKISLQQYRGDELIYEIRDDNFDSNLQESRVLKSEQTFKPGDAYVVTCTYNTVGRDNVTVGGGTVAQEMCLAFVFYYPRQTEIDYCMSNPSLTSFWETFEIPHDTEYSGDIDQYTYKYVLTQVEPDRLRTGLRDISDKAKRYNQCLNSDFNLIGPQYYELDFPSWFDPEKRLAAPNTCMVTVGDDVDLKGYGNTLRAGYISVITTIACYMLFLY